jgi:hypothetical protein
MSLSDQDKESLGFFLRDTQPAQFVNGLIQLAEKKDFEKLGFLQSACENWQGDNFLAFLLKSIRETELKTAFAVAVKNDLLSQPAGTLDAEQKKRLMTVGHDLAAEKIDKLIAVFNTHAAAPEIFSALLRGAEKIDSAKDTASPASVFLAETDKLNKETSLKRALAALTLQ